MIEVENLINERRQDIERIKNLLADNISSSEYAKLLKANIFIMLYNLVEGVVTQTYTSLFDTIMNSNSNFEDLNDKIKLMYLELQVGKLENSNNILLFLSTFAESHKISYDDYSKIKSLYSGNIDAKTIRELNQRIGIRYELHVEGEEHLLTIKNNRNRLAHGEVSYSEIGRDYTESDLEKYIDATFAYVSSYNNLLEQYINGEGYLKIKEESIDYII